MHFCSVNRKGAPFCHACVVVAAVLSEGVLPALCLAGVGFQQQQRDMQYVQMMKSKWMLKMGMSHNTTRQKHFRAQVMF